MQFANMSDMNKELVALILMEVCSALWIVIQDSGIQENPNTDQETNNFPIPIFLPSLVCDVVGGLSGWEQEEGKFVCILYV